MINDALKAEILSSRALSYRRVVLALSVILSAIHWFPGLNLNDLSLFGVKPPVGQGRALVLGVLWSLLAYHAVTFSYYAWRDWRVWLVVALDVPSTGSSNYWIGFPEMQMFYGKPPLAAGNRWRGDGKPIDPEDWHLEAGPNEVQWAQKIPDPHTIVGYRYSLSPRRVKDFKEKVRWFRWIDAGVPVAAALLTLGMSFWTTRCWGLLAYFGL